MADMQDAPEQRRVRPKVSSQDAPGGFSPVQPDLGMWAGSRPIPAEEAPGGDDEEVVLLEDPEEVFAQYDHPDVREEPPVRSSRSILAIIINIGLAYLIWTFFKTDTFAMTKLVDGATPYIVLAVIVLLGSGLALFLSNRRALQVMAERSMAAGRILGKVQEGREPEPFILYLRPFAMGRGLEVESTMLGDISFEEVLANALTHIGTLVAVGRADPQPGAAKLESSDGDWEKKVSGLAAASRLILLVPGGESGLRWELEEIRDRGFLSKTIFLKPPGFRDTDWDVIVARTETLGLSLPYSTSGVTGSCAFLLDVRGAVIGLKKLSSTLSVIGYRDTISELYQRLEELKPGEGFPSQG